MKLWEILVPTEIGGKPIRTRYHRVWDAKVRRITKGLTICRPAIGQWVSPSGLLFKERMIPVRVACDETQIQEIIDLTLWYYNQEAVFVSLISEQVIIKHRAEVTNTKYRKPRKI